MKKALGISLIALLPFSILATPTFAAVKAGDVCSKSGLTSIVSGKKYTCVKTGKKLVWKLSTSTQPNNAPTQTNKATAEIPAPQLFGSLDVLVADKKNIQSVAFSEVQKLASQKNSNPLIINAKIGPTTKLTDQKYADALQTAHNIFKNSNQPPTLDILYHNFADLNWAKDQWQFIKKGNGDTFPGLEKCKGITWCSYGVTLPGDKNAGLIVVADGKVTFAEFLGVNEIHEYTHVVQLHIMNNAPLSAPGWWTEGQAMFFGVAGASKDLNSYLLLQNRQRSIWNFKAIPDFELTQSSISNFLLSKSKDNIQNSLVLSYSLGQAFVESLVAIKGADLSMKIWVEIAKGRTFNDAFNSLYGFTLEQAVEEISPIIFARFK